MRRPATRIADPASRRRAQGQGMTEYIVIVALVAVAAIGVYSMLGQTLRHQTAGLAMEVSGQNAQTAIAASRTSATSAQSRAADANKPGLGRYNTDNDQN